MRKLCEAKRLELFDSKGNCHGALVQDIDKSYFGQSLGVQKKPAVNHITINSRRQSMGLCRTLVVI